MGILGILVSLCINKEPNFHRANARMMPASTMYPASVFPNRVSIDGMYHAKLGNAVDAAFGDQKARRLLR
jgi:hypothetical protein